MHPAPDKLHPTIMDVTDARVPSYVRKAGAKQNRPYVTRMEGGWQLFTRPEATEYTRNLFRALLDS
jgi:hypothetical protein